MIRAVKFYFCGRDLFVELKENFPIELVMEGPSHC